MKFSKYWVYLFILFCSCNLLENAARKKRFRGYEKKKISCGHPNISQIDTLRALEGFRLKPLFKFSTQYPDLNDLTLYFVDYNNLRVGIYECKFYLRVDGSFSPSTYVKTIGVFKTQKDTLTLFKSLTLGYGDTLANDITSNNYNDCFHLFQHNKSVAAFATDFLKRTLSELFAIQLPTTQYLIRREYINYVDGRDRCEDLNKYKRQIDFLYLTPINKDSVKYILPTQEKFEAQIGWCSYKKLCTEMEKKTKTIQSEGWLEDERKGFEYNSKQYISSSLLSEVLGLSIDTTDLTGKCTPPTNQQIYDFLLKYTKAP